MTAATPVRRTRAPRRGAAVALVVGTLAVLGVTSAATAPAAPSAVPPSSMAVGLGDESAAAFCAGLEHEPGVVTSTVAVANLAHAPRTLEVTTSDTAGRVVHGLVRVAAGRVVHLDPAATLDGANDAVSIVANGGGVAATEAISTPAGIAVAPCLTQTAPSWSMGGGSTEPGQSLTVSVFNPTTTIAVFTVAFLGPNGPVEPLKYHDLLLRPHRAAALRVHDVAPNLAPITTQVTASSGNVVALAVEQATSGAMAVSLVPGLPQTGTSATFPITPTHGGVTTRLLLANPGATAIDASVAAAWSPGCGAHCAAPFGVAVPPASATLLQVAPSARVPIGVPMSVRVSASAPGLVVVQRVRTTRSLGQVAPLDDPAGAGALELVLLDPTRSGFSRVTITNPGTAPASVALEAPGTHTPTTHLTVVVAPHGVATIGLHRLGWVRGGVVELASSAPVYASAQVRAAVLGSDLLTAVPLR